MTNTLKELSERLGVSTSTVSRALNGQGLMRRSSRAKAEQIKALAAEMGYAPNSLARSLKTKRRQVIGLMLPDIMNDYYAAAATLVERTLTTEGYRVLLCVTNDDPVLEAAQLRMLQEERVAGVVIVPAPQPQGTGTSQPHHRGTVLVPQVELVRQRSVQMADAVLIDDIDAGHQAAQHLISLGHRRIAVLAGPPNLSTSRLRLAGYREALEEAGIGVDETLICTGPYRREAARSATMRVLELGSVGRPTALIATSNELVVGALQAIAATGVDIPSHLSLVGFGNPDWFALLRPSLTTVALPIEEMATVAARLLLKRIHLIDAADDDTPTQPVISRYQAHLLVRDSTRALNSSSGQNPRH